MMLLLLAASFSMLALVALVFSLSRPNGYVLIYLLVFTQFLGFVDFKSIEVEGVFNILLYLNMLTIIASFIKVLLDMGSTSRGWSLLFIVMLFFGYGLIAPIMHGDSGFKAALIDGKDFLSFSLLGYMLAFRNEIHIRTLADRVVLIGVGLSLIVILAVFGGIAITEYPLSRPHLGITAGVRILSPSLMSLGFFFLVHRLKSGALSPGGWLCLGITLVGLVYQEHRAIMLCTLCASFIYYFYRSSFNQLFIAGILIILLMSSVLAVRLSDDLAYRFFSPVEELIEGKGAMLSRSYVNLIRWDLIEERPVAGYGFIDESSPRGKEHLSVTFSRFEQTYGTVDSGYVDLLIRFGYLGAALYLLPWLTVGLLPILSKRAKGTLGESCGFYVLILFPVCITWSMFTYVFGIVPLSLCVFIILNESQVDALQEGCLDA